MRFIHHKQIKTNNDLWIRIERFLNSTLAQTLKCNQKRWMKSPVMPLLLVLQIFFHYLNQLCSKKSHLHNLYSFCGYAVHTGTWLMWTTTVDSKKMLKHMLFNRASPTIWFYLFSFYFLIMQMWHFSSKPVKLAAQKKLNQHRKQTRCGHLSQRMHLLDVFWCNAYVILQFNRPTVWIFLHLRLCLISA